MSVVDRERVAAAFESARDYDRNAAVQRRIAAALAGRIARMELPPDARILEIGCGTGFLTRELLDRGIAGEWLITDKAPAMVERCRGETGEAPGRVFAVLDGEYGMARHDGRYDLICASMAMQWFDDLEGAVARLMTKLAPGGHLVFNTLAAGTFAEWIAAHEACDLEAGAIVFPQANQLLRMLDRFGPVSLTIDRHVESHDNARQFLERLRLIGASTARKGHVPLAPGDLKRVMAEFDEGGARATYEVVTCHIENARAS